jgi:DNA-binding response OmpR family regulator
MKILVVDDHAQTATSISRMLEFWGNTAIEAYNALDAIKFAKEEHPDLILLDLIMDGEDGYYVLNELPKNKFIIMSGFETDLKKIKKYKNITRIIKKPIDFEELEKIIKHLRI